MRLKKWPDYQIISLSRWAEKTVYLLARDYAEQDQRGYRSLEASALNHSLDKR